MVTKTVLKYYYYTDNCDNNNEILIGAIVGVDCTVIIIMVITNIMVWIYCFRRRHHTGVYTYIYIYICMYIAMYVTT